MAAVEVQNVGSIEHHRYSGPMIGCGGYYGPAHERWMRNHKVALTSRRTSLAITNELEDEM